VIKERSQYLHQLFNIEPSTKILLYFGAVFQERKIDELVETFENSCDNNFELVIHGPGDFSHLDKSKKIKLSNQLLDYDDLHLIINSASIGLALYDNGWPNTRLTAFASEKIARYLQAGVPFIAFENESYINLQNQFLCCELIERMDELSRAMNKIMSNYESYREFAYQAYSKYYRIEETVKPLINYIKDRINFIE
jgi:glycosyltransferase involved in cell wall biosynthesis